MFFLQCSQVVDIKLDKDRLQAMLRLAETKQSNAERALEETRSEKKAVEQSLAEEQQRAASLESSLKVTQSAKESLIRQVDLLEEAKKKVSTDLLAGQQKLHRLAN